MKYLAATLLSAFFTPAWAVNKCVDAQGKVSYQNEPCVGQGEKVKLHDTGTAPRDTDVYKKRNEMSEQIRQSALKVIQAKTEACGAKTELAPAVGMSESDFLCTGTGIHGVRKINQTTTAAGVSRQYAIRDGGYVYVDNGVITAVQD